MDNSKSIAFDAYLKACKRFKQEYENFINLCKMHGENTIVLSKDCGAVIALREAISWSMSLYSKININTVSKEDKFYMSGIKYIDNVWKHEKIDFDLYSMLRPGVSIAVNVSDKSDEINIKAVNIKPILVWGGLENIPIRTENINQRKNFMRYVKEKGIIESVDKISAILKKYY